jgi:hypothetical protein
MIRPSMRRAVVALALVLLSRPAAAQVRGFSLGFEALSSDLTSTADGYESDADWGYRFGATVTLPRGRWYLQPGLFYQDANFNLRPEGSGRGIDGGVKGIYVPVVAGINLGIPKVGLDLTAGPTVTFRTGSGELDNDATNSVLFGGTVGASVRILFLNANLGYDFGFTNVFRDAAREEFGSGNLNSWRLSLGFIVGG